MSRLFNTTLFLDRQICTERVNAKFKMPFQRYIYFLPSGKLVLGTSDRVGRLKFHQRWMEFLPPFYSPPPPPSRRNVEFTIFDYRNELKRRGLKKQTVLFDRVSLNGNCWNCGYKGRLMDSGSSMKNSQEFFSHFRALNIQPRVLSVL